MDFLDMEGIYGSDYDLDREEGYATDSTGVEFIAIPAWRMADGRLIAIQKMDTSHIKNCMRMIYRSNGTWRREYLPYFKDELIKRKHLPDTPPIVYIDL